MEQLKIKKSLGLAGEISISGSKNAALPIICASILTSDTIHLENVPDLKDVKTLSKILQSMGIAVNIDNHCMQITAHQLTNYMASYELVKTMRASILVLGPLLARFGQARVSLPGGCAIGTRPVDQHIKGLKAMGAHIEIKDGYIYAEANTLIGAEILMDVVTVTGTENLLMAATIARGQTILRNCAKEPEVTDLANCLISMGAQIQGIGSDTLTINGVPKLFGTTYRIIADRIEAGTYAVAAAITHSNILLTNARPDTMTGIMDKLKLAGAQIQYGDDYLQISNNKPLQAVDIRTSPYPEFPTDMQAQFMVLNCIAHGKSIIQETIFENRYMHVPELCRMGANIIVDGATATIQGLDNNKTTLNGTTVMATDLRASASLVLAGLVSNGETTVDRIYHLDRGYEAMEKKLNQVGANIVRINNNKN